MIYTADFETTTDKNDCRVWAWGLCDIVNYNFTYSNTIESFISQCFELCEDESLNLYFHNLKFDGEFILCYLLENGWTHTTDRKLTKPKTFTTLISDMGVWYNISINFGNGRVVHIYDSLKILPFSVSQVAKSFGLEESKLKIDYKKYREYGHILTQEEIDYLKNDVLIMAKALRKTFDHGDTRMTAGSNALADYKKRLSRNNFEKYFPALSEEEDTFIRHSYKGGWTYCNPKYQGKDIGRGIVLDVNSLYPSRMKFCKMPYGTGKYYTGKYQVNRLYPLYVQKIRCKFEIKENRLPTIQIKKSAIFSGTEYLESSDGERVELTLTNVDLKLFKEHYHIEDLEYVEGYMYKAVTGMFDEYIDYHMSQKIEADKSGNYALRTLSKLKMNSLYGKFAKRPKGCSKIPFLYNGVLKFELGEEEDQGSLYIPVGTFITSYARDYTIRSAQKVYKRFLYADTDSLHLIDTDIPKSIKVDKYELGAWKKEAEFIRARYLGAKCYIEDIVKTEEEINEILDKIERGDPEADFLVKENVSRETSSYLQCTCAGLPDRAKINVRWNNFHYGQTYHGKLRPSHTPGGIVLEETTFQIRSRI